MTIVYDDYDTPWKNIIETYFEKLMAFFFPEVDRLQRAMGDVGSEQQPLCHCGDGAP